MKTLISILLTAALAFAGGHAATDGMGRTVYAYCRDTHLLLDGETWEHAIDSAINSGVVLLVPGEDGKRHEVPAKVLAVSDIYGANAPEF